MQEPDATPGVATQATANPAERFEQLEASYEEAYEAWMLKVNALYEAAEKAGTVDQLEWPAEPIVDFFLRFVNAAEDYAGSDGAVPFLLWMAENGGYQMTTEAVKALETLVESHLDCEKLDKLGPALINLSYSGGEEKVLALAAKIEANTASDNLRAWAVYVRLSGPLQALSIHSEEFKKAKAEMQSHLAKCDDPRLMSTYNTNIGVREAFAIGSVAPDIAGTDLDGVDFKLSDYNGKIIFLDFWGDW